MSVDRQTGRFEVDGVTVRFGGLTALDGVSLAIEPGQVRGVIGPNGAGKTTLFNVLCGFISPSEGRLSWRGEELGRHAPHRLAQLGISRTLQGVGLFPGMTVLENVMTGAGQQSKAGFASAFFGLPRADAEEARLRDQAMAMLTELGAAKFAQAYPANLPYPDQKKVSLARALVSQPQLLMLDEPAAGLSSGEMDELGAVIRRLSSTMSIMLVEHHMDLVMSVCDAITVLDFGKVIADGSPDEVREDPGVLAAYLGLDVDGNDDPDPDPDDAAAAPSTKTATVKP